MFCPICGEEILEGAERCLNCGTPVEKEIHFSDVTSYAGRQMSKAVSGVSSKAQASMETYRREKSERNMGKLADIVVDPQEQQIALLGSNYLDSMVHGDGLKEGRGLLTDRRFYFRGKCLTKIAGQYKAVDKEYTIDLENITATSFVYTRRLLLLVFAIFVLIETILKASRVYRGGETILFFGGCLASILFLLYFLSKRTIYEVHFAGEVVGVNVLKYGGLGEVKRFNKALCQAKDRRR